jgi:peptidoglycan hydrolase-like protein with peptidoglycan-binding domain
MSHKPVRTKVGRVCLRFALAAAVLSIACASAIFAQPTVRTATNKSSLPPQSSHAAIQQSKSKKKAKRRPHRDIGQKVPSTDRIQEIQTALSREGYYKGDPSGKWDSDSQDAMRRFQEEHNLTGSGKFDAQSLQKLGLGSDIAGVSAPRPPQLPTQQSKPASAPAATGSATNMPANTPATSRQ